MRRSTRKNLLDLEYQTQLQRHSTTIILTCTFLIGVALALLTGQLATMSVWQVAILGLASAILLSVMTVLLLRFKAGMTDALRKIARI